MIFTSLQRMTGFYILLIALMQAAGCGDAKSTDAHGHGHGEAAEAQTAAAPDASVDTALGEHPPFEWMGVYTIPNGKVELVIQPGPDASMNIALVPVRADTREGLDAAVQEAKRVAEAQPAKTSPGVAIAPDGRFYELQDGGTEEMRFAVNVPATGKYALLTQHFADEFQTLFQGPSGQIDIEAQRIFKPRFGQINIPPEAVKTFGI